MKTIIFLNTHPIQYFAPLYAYCNKHGLKVDAWYCSDENINGGRDVEFGKNIKWDIPLLEGYSYRFFKNYSWKPSISNGYFGLINLGVIPALFKEPKSIFVVHGWGYLTSLLLMIFGKIAGHKIFFRGETPLKQELLHTPSKLFFRKLVLQHLMFRLIDKFLFVGKQNAAFYKYYGVKDQDLVFVPYAVDNARFNESFQKLKPNKNDLRAELGIPVDHFVILFSGKYIQKKRPLDLVKAFHLAGINNSSLVLIGEGELRKDIQTYIDQNKVQNVHLTGFINQSSIPAYYIVGDVFVMSSEAGETWGLSVNEAMNFSLPIIASDLVGCTEDILIDEENGYTYKCGDVNALSHLLKKISNADYVSLGSKSQELISNYSFEVIKNNLQINSN